MRRTSLRLLFHAALAAIALCGHVASAEAGIRIIGATQTSRIVRPGDAVFEVFRFKIWNENTAPETLMTLGFDNRTVGPGDQSQLDQEWTTLSFFASRSGGSIIVEPGNGGVPTARFTQGVARFTDLRVVIPAGEQVSIVIGGSASLGARDGDALDLRIGSAASLSFSRAVTLTGNFPIDPSGSFPVEGMAAAAITVQAVESANLPVGSHRNLAFDFTVPADGYVPDLLEKINVENLGSAQAGRDIALVEAWVDDGDGTFDPTKDFLLGSLTFTGNRWEITGIAVDVPIGGTRIFITVDIGEGAFENSKVRLGLPGGPDLALQMQTGNSGPVDHSVANPFEQAVSTADRVSLAAVPIEPAAVRPGQRSVVLLDLFATNTYSDTRQLTGITFRNTAEGPGSGPDLDAEVERLTLRADGDGDGVLGDVTVDPALGTAFFVAGRAAFAGFTWDLPPGESGRLFLTADVALLRAADGDLLGAAVSGPADVTFSNPTAVAASWPIDPGASLKVDGMVAGEVTNFGAPGITLAPAEGPTLALDVIVRRNGYADDVLTGFSVENQGSAMSTDLTELRLWRDGGDGLFDAGAGDDRDLGTLGAGTEGWTSAPLSEGLGQSGARLFVSARVAPLPVDSATVQLAIPAGGITVASDNDGPVDAAVANPDALLLSNAPLLASVSVTPAASTIGQTVTARMVVRNTRPEAVNATSPSALTASGTGTLTLQSGPAPASAVLPAGGQQTFTWTYTSAAAGDVRLAGSAAGTGAASGLPYQSLPISSGVHRVFGLVDSLALDPFPAMPPTVNRGQTDVIPIYLTFTNGGGAGGADVLLRSLRVRLETATGAGVVPDQLLTRAVVSAGGVTYLDRSSLETSGSTLDLTLATPILVGVTEPVTVALRVDIAPGTTVPDFRVVIPDATWFGAEDATSGAPVAIALQSGSYPVGTAVARVLIEAARLDVAGNPPGLRRAGRGQRDVPLLGAQLTNPGVSGVSGDVRVGGLAVILMDSTGAAVASPARWLTRLKVRSGSQLLADWPMPAADTLIAVSLSPVLAVPVNTPVDLQLSADLADSVAVGRFRVRLADTTLFDARDGSTGRRVIVAYAPDPLSGDTVRVESRADTLYARGVALLPPTVSGGSAGVYAMRAVLRHPGNPWTGRIRVDSLAIRCVDDAGNPLVSGAYVDLLRVIWNGAQVGSLPDVPLVGGPMGVRLSGAPIEPGDSAVVELVLDFEGTSPPTYFSLTLAAAGITALDANVAVPVGVAPEAGVEFPLVSGLTRIAPPARTLAVGLMDRMPAALAPDGLEIAVARVTLDNQAAPGSSSILVDHFVVRAADPAFTPAVLGRGAAGVAIYRGGLLWAQSAPLSTDSVFATVSGPQIALAPGVPQTLELRITPRTDPSLQALRVGFDDSDVGVIQPSNPLLLVTVQAESGQSFPLWTERGSFTPTGLAASYSNFPNPFAAGREATTFAWYMPGPGRVNLQIWSPRGERVTVLLADAARSPGLQQRDGWDGRNGRGMVVANGVYVAELLVRLDDGTTHRLLRKVAVVR